tara:strand:- start:985 stop:1257 length:273 start_codon:yes stop_codon:yes gene_type:complete
LARPIEKQGLQSIDEQHFFGRPAIETNKRCYFEQTKPMHHHLNGFVDHSMRVIFQNFSSDNRSQNIPMNRETKVVHRRIRILETCQQRVS